MDDLISRQAAINAICKTECGACCKIDCDEIKAIKAVPSAQPEQQWIPCIEKLPESEGRCLVSVLDGRAIRTTVAPYHPRSRSWALTGRMAYWKVIAWMPLPEPYKGEQDELQTN